MAKAQQNENGRRRRRNGYAPEETRAALVASGLRLFETQGYHATSVTDIVDDAALTKGAFYHHFDSKEDLLHIIHEEYIDHRLAGCNRVLDEYTFAEDRLRALIREAIVNIDQFRSHVTIFLQERRFLGGERFEKIKKRRDEVDRIYRQVIEQGIDEGVFTNRTPAQLSAFGVLGMCAWAHTWFRPSGELSAAAVGDHLASLVIDGLKSGASGKT